MKMVNGTITELVCTDGRKSFYGKAKVVTYKGVKTLYSYNTPVAKIGKNGKFTRLWAGYSATTMRHVNSFLDAYGVEGGGKAWWDNQKVGKE